MSLRVVQLVHGYPPAVGGVENSVRDICEGLVRLHRAEVTVLTTDAYTNSNFRDPALATIPILAGEERNGVRIERYPVNSRMAPLLRVLQGVAWRAKLPGNDWLRTWYQGPLSPGLRDAARSCQADVICAASFPLNHLFYAFRRRGPQPPVVLLAAIHPDDRWGYHRPNLLGLVSRSAMTVASTEPERDWLVGQGAPAERVEIIPHGIRLGHVQVVAGSFRARHGIAADELVIAFLGQQGPHKGIEVLLDTLPALMAALPMVRLVVAGARTPYSRVVRLRAAALSPEHQQRLLILDDLAEQEKAELLAGCDIFCSPSAYESFGLTTLEAWEHRRVVVMGDGPAQRWLLQDGALGGLVPYGDRAALTKVLIRLGRSSTLREELGEVGHNRLRERYQLDAEIEAHHELFLSVTGRSH